MGCAWRWCAIFRTPWGCFTCSATLAAPPQLWEFAATHWGGEAELRAAAERTGLVIDPGLVIVENPSIHRVRAEVQRRLEGGQLDAIIGSSTDINAVATLDPTTAIHIDHGGAWTGSGPKVVEFGFPCRSYHVVRSSPTFGFAGVLGWADRLVNAPRLWDTWRNQPT